MPQLERRLPTSVYALETTPCNSMRPVLPPPLVTCNVPELQDTYTYHDLIIAAVLITATYRVDDTNIPLSEPGTLMEHDALVLVVSTSNPITLLTADTLSKRWAIRYSPSFVRTIPVEMILCFDSGTWV
jgi:hypothetical protein